MIDYYKRNIQFVIMVSVWILSGMYGGPSFYVIIPGSLLLMRMRNMHSEMLFGFMIIAVLSDHWKEQLLWASKIKDIYMLMMVVFFMFNSKEFKYRNMVIGPFLLYLVWMFIPLLRSPEAFLSFQKTVSTFLLYAIIPVFMSKCLEEEKEHFIKGAVLTMVSLFIYGLFMAVILPGSAFIMGRFQGVTGNPNALGILCTVFFGMFTIIITHYRNYFTRNEIIFIYAVVLISVILSGSRNTIVSILIFWGFSYFFKQSYLFGFTALIVIAVSYHLLIANLPYILDSLGLQEYMRVENIDDGSGRLIAWKFSLDHLKNDYLIGHGVGYEVYMFRTFGYDLFVRLHVGNTHNSWLALWLNSGIIGLILYAGGLIYRFVSYSSKTVYALPMLYSVMFSATFESWLAGALSPFILQLLIVMSIIGQLSPEPEDLKAESLPLDGSPKPIV
ncbi:MAG: O-antigen ligase family protein [Bacteroidia bacterium]|nr:O-antigen ligase family protein [Bacteroidia bacterium]MCZ2278152.1 O-antigen ligase family protein [Bacteroidia bacterium]